MKILLTVLMTALCVFALATAWVDYVQPQLNKTAKIAATRPDAVAETAPTRKRPRKPARIPESELVPVPADDGEVPSQTPDDAPPARAAKRLVERMEDVKARESELAARQEALRMIYDDIRAELSSVDDLRKRTSEDLLAAERRGVKTQPRASAVPPLSARRTPPGPRSASDSVANRGKAFILQRLVDEGKMDTAVSMLKGMKQRDAAGVLESLESTDSKLADRLATMMQSDEGAAVRR